MNQMMEYTAIWMDKPVTMIRDKQFLRTKRITEGDVVGVKDNKLDTSGHLHKVLNCAGSLDSSIIELQVMKLSNNAVSIVKIQ